MVCSSSKNVGKEACTGVCKKQSLCLPQLPEEKHRLVKLRLIICEISGVDSESRDFRTQLFQLCAPHGALGLRGDTPHTYKDGVGMPHRRHTDPVSSTVSEPVNFLATLLDSGLGYNAICVARSALSSYLVLKDGVPFGQQKLVIRFIKGVFEMKPALPKYSNTWNVNVNVVFNYLELLHPHNKLTLKESSQKLAMLLALLSGQRCQTIL